MTHLLNLPLSTLFKNQGSLISDQGFSYQLNEHSSYEIQNWSVFRAPHETVINLTGIPQKNKIESFRFTHIQDSDNLCVNDIIHGFGKHKFSFHLGFPDFDIQEKSVPGQPTLIKKQVAIEDLKYRKLAKSIQFGDNLVYNLFLKNFFTDVDTYKDLDLKKYLSKIDWSTQNQATTGCTVIGKCHRKKFINCLDSYSYHWISTSKPHNCNSYNIEFLSEPNEFVMRIPLIVETLDANVEYETNLIKTFGYGQLLAAREYLKNPEILTDSHKKLTLLLEALEEDIEKQLVVFRKNQELMA